MRPVTQCSLNFFSDNKQLTTKLIMEALWAKIYLIPLQILQIPKACKEMMKAPLSMILSRMAMT